MKKRSFATAVLAATLFTMSVPAMAEYYTTPDGAIVLDIPDKTWNVVEDDATVTTLSDGKNTITVLHYEADDTLPTIAVPDEKYAASYQVVMADKEDIYVITGAVTDEKDFADVKKIVQTAAYYEENAYAGAGSTTNDTTADQTAEKVNEDAALAATQEISAMDAVMYAVADGGLNIRSACSSSASVIGTYAYGESMNIIGNVYENGKESGWYQVGYKEQIGYVSADYVSAVQPDDVSATISDGSNDELTGNVVYVYNEDGSTTVVKEYTDGVWRDRMGYTYEATSDGHWVCQQEQQ